MIVALLDRIKQRAETDLDDAELQRLIDEANNDIITRFGPHASPDVPIEELLEGYRKRLIVSRPIDASHPVTVTEFGYPYLGSAVANVLTTDDYQLWPPYTLERLNTKWGDRVKVQYTPVNDGDQRQEVIIKLVMLSIAWDGSGTGLRSTSVGDVTTTNPDYISERNKILSSLTSRGELMMR